MRKACLALLLAASVTPAFAQDKTFDLKISHWVPASHPLQKSLEDWAAAVEKDSGGTIKSKVFPAQQLGKAFDHYDMARDGIADVTYVNPGYQPGRFPIISAGELPFLMSDAKGGSEGLDAWYRKYAGQEMKQLPQEERNRIGETIFRFYFGCMYRHHQFSGDPHPGNSLLLDDGRMAFLDFGLFKRIPAEVATVHAAIEEVGKLLAIADRVLAGAAMPAGAAV